MPITNVAQNIDASQVVSGRFVQARLPDGALGQVLTAQGVGVSPAYGIDVDVEILAKLLKDANFMHIPTNAGWQPALGGSGFASQAPTLLLVTTGVTANSQGSFDATLATFPTGTNSHLVIWDKKFYFIFNIARGTSDTQVVARLQIKEVFTEGPLGAKGIGLKVLNYSLWGESYGTQLGEVDLGVVLGNLVGARVMIIHDPSVPKIEWYVDGVLKGTQSTATKIPSGSAGGTNALFCSIINGATGGVNAVLRLSPPLFWQVR